MKLAIDHSEYLWFHVNNLRPGSDLYHIPYPFNQPWKKSSVPTKCTWTFQVIPLSLTRTAAKPISFYQLEDFMDQISFEILDLMKTQKNWKSTLTE